MRENYLSVVKGSLPCWLRSNLRYVQKTKLLLNLLRHNELKIIFQQRKPS